MTGLSFSYCEAWPLFGGLQLLNILSNGIFLYVAFRVWQQDYAKWSRYALLAIALCSTLWHVSGQFWALLLDIAAILVWFACYMKDWTHYKPGASTVYQRALFILALLSAGMATWSLTENFMPLLSGVFLPWALVLFYVGFFRSQYDRVIILSGFAMIMAVAARELDLDACDISPVGTHFIWHIGAGLSLFGAYRIMRVGRFFL